MLLSISVFSVCCGLIVAVSISFLLVQTGPRWNLPVWSTTMWCCRASETVFQRTAWACLSKWPARSVHQGPTSRHWEERFCHTTSFLSPGWPNQWGLEILFQFSTKSVSEVRIEYFVFCNKNVLFFATRTRIVWSSKNFILIVSLHQHLMQENSPIL